MERYILEVLGFWETIRSQAGRTKINSIIYIKAMRKKIQHAGVAIMLSEQAENTLIGLEPIFRKRIGLKFRT